MKTRPPRAHIARPVYKLLRLLTQPEFWVVTLVGNAVTALGALGIYALEHGTNPKIGGALDAFWWSVQTVTSVGYGDVFPVTSGGRVVGIAMMIVGTAIFCSYTALFAGALLGPELVQEVEREIEAEEKPLHDELRALEAKVGELQATLQSTLKKARSK